MSNSTSLEMQKRYLARAKETSAETIVFTGSRIIRFGDVSKSLEWDRYDIPGVLSRHLIDAGVSSESIQTTEHGGLPSIITGPLTAEQMLKFAASVAKANAEYEMEPFKAESENWVRYGAFVVNRELCYLLDQVTEDTIFNFLPRCFEAILVDNQG